MLLLIRLIAENAFASARNSKNIIFEQVQPSKKSENKSILHVKK
jgi:hypothetical protein